MKRHQPAPGDKGRRSRIVKKWDGSPAQAVPANPATKPPSIRDLHARLREEPGDSNARTQLAERLLSQNKPADVIELLESPHSPLSPEKADANRWRAARCLAFAYAGLKRFDDARRVAETGTEALGDSADFHYLLAYIGNRIDAPTLSATHARAFLSLMKTTAGDRDVRFNQTAALSYEVHNYLGAALEHQGHLDDAMESYENALQIRPTFDIAWANLIRLLDKVGRHSEALAVAQKAHDACPRSKVLPKLRKRSRSEVKQTPVSGGRRATIALCMIVKNEEEQLPRCLASAKPLVDEMIVIDTGSTDRTVEIAKSFGASVHHHAWEGDFSKARNISMGYADADWIFILDADEELESRDVPFIRSTIESTEFKAISVSVYNYSAQKRMYTSFLPSVRLFRRDLGAYYEGIVHNQLRFPGEDGVLRIAARINHYGYGLAPEVMARKIARSKALLEQQLCENPDNGFAHFNLAQLLRGSEDESSAESMDKVIFHAGRAVDLSSPDHPNERHVHIMALHQLVTAYFNKRDYERAAVHAHRALALKPGYLDAILSLGHIHSMDGRHDLARKYYLEYLDRQKSFDEHAEVDHVILLHLRSRHNALYGLGLIAEMQNNLPEAIDWYERCVREREDYLDTGYRLGMAYSQLGQKDKARLSLKRESELHPASTEVYLALADLLSEMGEPDDAMASLDKGLERDPRNSRLLLSAAQHALRRRDVSAAEQYLDAVLPDDPNRSHATRVRADVYYEQGRYSEAKNLYEECLRERPDDWDIINNLGNCRFHTADFDGAELLYRRIIDAGRADKHVYRNLGVTLARMERIDDAVFALESYAQMDPDDVESAGFLGDLHYGRRDYARAIDEYEKVLDSQPQRPDTLTRLADCYLNRGSIAAALLGYERALAADPEYRPAWARLRDIRNYLVTRIKDGEQPPSADGGSGSDLSGAPAVGEEGGMR
jgi:tetratricopeptide (TPR) repeat protein